MQQFVERIATYHFHEITRVLPNPSGDYGRVQWCLVPQYTRYRCDRRFIKGYREGFHQILNFLEFAHAHFEGLLDCRE